MAIIRLFVIALVFVAGCGGDDPEPLRYDCDPGRAGPNCKVCISGTYCPGGDALEEPCPDGTWDADMDPSTNCRGWTICTDDELQAREGTTTTDRICELRSTCDPGEYIASQSLTADRTCAACPDGTFSDAPNQMTCTPWSVCGAGVSFVEEGTETTDTVCEACPEGTFNLDDDVEECTPFTDCSAGTFVEMEGSASADRVCTMCEVGTFTDTMNATECTPWTLCVDNEYVAGPPDFDQDRDCQPCPDGTFSDGPNAAECM